MKVSRDAVPWSLIYGAHTAAHAAEMIKQAEDIQRLIRPVVMAVVKNYMGAAMSNKDSRRAFEYCLLHNLVDISMIEASLSELLEHPGIAGCDALIGLMNDNAERMHLELSDNRSRSR